MNVGSVRRFYGRWARLYDALATFPVVGRWRERAADALRLQPGDTVVAMGCGTGANLPHLHERVGPDGRVVGVDLTRPVLARAIATGRADQGSVHLLRGDATRPPLVEAEADAVIGSFVVGMFQDPATVVEDWCDLLGPGGRIALVDMSRSDHPVGRALNPVFRAFVVASTPSGSPIEALSALGRPGADRQLTERVRAARTALAERTVDHRFETLGLGFVGLLAGRVA